MTSPSLHDRIRAALKADEKITGHLADYTDHEDLTTHLHGHLHGVNLTPDQETDPGTLIAIHAAEHDEPLRDARARFYNAAQALTTPGRHLS
jgi:uncharacterized protein YbjT (DUF2867 family)